MWTTHADQVNENVIDDVCYTRPGTVQPSYRVEYAFIN